MKLRKPDFLKSKLERYRDALETNMETKAAIFRERSVKKGSPMVYTVAFDRTSDSPVTSFSYGLSFVSHAEQPLKTELCLQTQSDVAAWIHVVGYLANHLRGDCPFKLGQIIRMGQPISSDSDMDAFLVSPVIDERIPSRLKDGRKQPDIHLVELIPVYAEETPKIMRLGVHSFIKRLGESRLDPERGRQ